MMGAVVYTLTGDFNGDNVVDAADYTVWRNSLGQTGGRLAADADGDGVVGMSDYALWKSHYGNSIGVSTGAGALANTEQLAGDTRPVPEPGTAFGILTGLGVMSMIFRRTSSLAVRSKNRGSAAERL